MKAIVRSRYGSPDVVLALQDIRVPAIADNDVLVRVHAAGLHIGDSFSVRGAPFAMRLSTGLRKPKSAVPGYDLAGEVAAVGSSVTAYQPGDAIYGASSGTWAEYAAVPVSRIARTPATLTFEEAAAMPTSALAALHALRNVGKVQPGQRVLIIGASGGIGSFAVQIAKAFGAEVSGVCSTRNVELVQALGADHVIDYNLDDFTLGTTRYDVIFDNVERRSLADCRRVLAPTGTLILNSGTGTRGLRTLARLAAPLVLSPFGRQNLRRFLSVPNHDDLVVLTDLVETGKLRPVIDRRFLLQDAADAIRYVESGHTSGKAIITLKPVAAADPVPPRTITALPGLSLR